MTTGLVKQCSKEQLEQLSTFENLLDYGEAMLQWDEPYFFNRIRELKKLCDAEEDYDLSLDSFRTMLLFVGAINNVAKPTILTVGESGLFYLKWKKDKKNGITVLLKTDYFLDYVIFKPSSYISKRIILNGSMYALDLVDYLKDLTIKLHQKL